MALRLGRDAIFNSDTTVVFREIEHHRMRVRFFETIALVNPLEQEMAIGKPGRLRTGWCIPICDSCSDFQTARSAAVPVPAAKEASPARVSGALGTI